MDIPLRSVGKGQPPHAPPTAYQQTYIFNIIHIVVNMLCCLCTRNKYDNVGCHCESDAIEEVAFSVHGAVASKKVGEVWTAGTSSKSAAQIQRRKQAIAGKLSVKKSSGVRKSSGAVAKGKAAVAKAGKVAKRASEAAQGAAAAAVHSVQTVSLLHVGFHISAIPHCQNVSHSIPEHCHLA